MKNARWPTGFHGTPDDILAGVTGQQKILAHLPNFLWFSVFEVLELHLPYVDGWGRDYNILAAAATVILYIGCLAACVSLMRRRSRWKRDYALLAVILVYTVLVFVLTDATPRYLMPVIFCYAAFAGIGYDRLLTLLSHGEHEHRHPGV